MFSLADLGDVVKFMIGGLPVIGALWQFHRARIEAHRKLDVKVDRLDADVDGLSQQLSGMLNDVERRFLTREEHTHVITRLDDNIVELNRTIGQLNTHLFDLARDRRGIGSGSL